jgi:cytochrome b subunit of formate dehydrogenase
VVAALSAGQAQQSGPGCESCHDQGQKLQASAHRSLACANCHAKHEEYPHPEGAAPAQCSQCHAAVAGEHAGSVHGQALRRGNQAAPNCAGCHGSPHETAAARSAEFRKAVPQTCGMCHGEDAQEFEQGAHGAALARGILQAPVCTDCHGEHSIQPHGSRASLVHPSHIRETCASCHDNVRLSRKFGIPQDRIVSFDASFHGLAARAGSQTVANCASCHGVHKILPSSHAESSIHPKNLPATCGRCHPGAGTRFALGPVHLWAGRTEPASVRLVRQTYLVLIPGLIGLMILHNLGDWVRKLRRLRMGGTPAARPVPHSPETRMYGFERLLHVLLLVSFVVLAWTGFQLKYPDQWWARPMLAWEETLSVRGIVHRVAAVLFLLAGVLHAGSLIASPRLREHWKKLWPRYTDAGDAVSGLAYNVGLRADKPRLPAYNYIEKAEYWAVVWGAVVMGVTGLLLWADNLAMAWFPKEVLDCATALHFYEAVLACLAIVVWHLYMVIFDPEVYPIDTTWLTGKSVRSHDAGDPDAAVIGIRAPRQW